MVNAQAGAIFSRICDLVERSLTLFSVFLNLSASVPRIGAAIIIVHPITVRIISARYSWFGGLVLVLVVWKHCCRVSCVVVGCRVLEVDLLKRYEVSN